MRVRIHSIERGANGELQLVAVDLDSHEVRRVSTQQLAVALVVHDAPIENAICKLTGLEIDTALETIKIPMNFTEQFKQQIRSRQREKRQINKEDAKQAEIKEVVKAYREREAERKRQAKEAAKGYARPGQLTEEERRKRRAEYFAKKRIEKNA